jgi:hypothetical protein
MKQERQGYGGSASILVSKTPIHSAPRALPAPQQKTVDKTQKICSVAAPIPNGPKTLNAISPTAPLQAPEIPTTDIGILERLIALGIQLADLAFRQAHEEATPKPPEQAAKEPRRQGRADSRLIFLRLRRAIHDTIAFKNRLIAAMMIDEVQARRKATPRPTPETATSEAPNPPEDPRRRPILRYFREGIDITYKRHKNPITHEAIEAHVTAELAKDPDQRVEGRNILQKICKSLDLPFYASHMPPELLRPPQPPAAAPP